MVSKKTTVSQSPVFNPLELVEDIVLGQDLPCQRLSVYEILSEVAGRWGEYRLIFLWQQEINVLHLTCVFDL